MEYLKELVSFVFIVFIAAQGSIIAAAIRSAQVMPMAVLALTLP